jgi:hypothetical protein
MNMNNLNIDIAQNLTLIEYFRYMYENAKPDWNVESVLGFFGKGKSNEGTDESKTIKRYYVEPTDKRFKEIYLNFDSNRNIESIYWILDKKKSELITLSELEDLFGEYKIQNIIYDETTEVIFQPDMNATVQYLRTSFLEWVEKRPNGTLYFNEGDREIEVDGGYEFSGLILKIKTLPNKTYKQ